MNKHQLGRTCSQVIPGSCNCDTSREIKEPDVFADIKPILERRKLEEIRNEMRNDGKIIGREREF